MRRLSRVAAAGCASIVLFAHPAIAQEEPESPGTAARPPVVISEVSTRGVCGPFDEAIELLNITNQPVDLAGWSVRVYSESPQLIHTIPLVGPSGESIVLAPWRNPGSTLVLTGTGFCGTLETPHVMPVNFSGPEGMPARVCIGLFMGSGPSLSPIDSVCFGRPWMPTPVGVGEGKPAEPENDLTAARGGSSTRNILAQDININLRDFSFQPRSFGRPF